MSLFLPFSSLNSCGRCLIPLATRRAASTIPLKRSIPLLSSAGPSQLHSAYFNSHASILSLTRSNFSNHATFPSNYFARSFTSFPKRSSAATLATPNEAPISVSNLPPLPTLTHPIVAYYLIGIAVLVFAIVVIGGLTRLTESGLSITEWNLVTGTLPPMNEEGWIEELRKYRLSPEGRLCVTIASSKYHW